MKSKLDIGLLIIRISIASNMLIYGITKLINGVSYISSLLSDYGLPNFLSYGVYVGEILAPLLIIIGYRTKIAGLVFALNCLVAILMVQLPNFFNLIIKLFITVHMIYLKEGEGFQYMLEDFLIFIDSKLHG